MTEITNSTPITIWWCAVNEPTTDFSSVRIAEPYSAPTRVPVPPTMTLMIALPETWKNISSGETKPRSIG